MSMVNGDLLFKEMQEWIVKNYNSYSKSELNALNDFIDNFGLETEVEFSVDVTINMTYSGTHSILKDIDELTEEMHTEICRNVESLLDTGADLNLDYYEVDVNS